MDIAKYDLSSFESIKATLDSIKKLIEEAVKLISDFVASWKKEIKFEVNG